MLIVESNPDNYTSRPKVTLPSIQPSPDQVWIIPLFALKAKGPNRPLVVAPPFHTTQTDHRVLVFPSQYVLLTCTLYTCPFPVKLRRVIVGAKKVCGHKESPGEVMRAKGRHFRLWWAYASRKQVKVCA